MHRMTKSHGKKNRSHNTILTKNLQYTCWQVVLTSLRNIALSQLSAASKQKNKCMYTPSWRHWCNWCSSASFRSPRLWCTNIPGSSCDARPITCSASGFLAPDAQVQSYQSWSGGAGSGFAKFALRSRPTSAITTPSPRRSTPASSSKSTKWR